MVISQHIRILSKVKLLSRIVNIVLVAYENARVVFMSVLVSPLLPICKTNEVGSSPGSAPCYHILAEGFAEGIVYLYHYG